MEWLGLRVQVEGEIAGPAVTPYLVQVSAKQGPGSRGRSDFNRPVWCWNNQYLAVRYRHCQYKPVHYSCLCDCAIRSGIFMYRPISESTWTGALASSFEVSGSYGQAFDKWFDRTPESVGVLSRLDEKPVRWPGFCGRSTPVIFLPESFRISPSCVPLLPWVP